MTNSPRMGLRCGCMVLLMTGIASSRTANYVSNGRANYLDSHLGQNSSTARILLLKGEEIILTDAVQQHISDSTLLVLYEPETHEGARVTLSLSLYPPESAFRCFQGPGYSIDNLKARNSQESSEACELKPASVIGLESNMTVYTEQPMVFAIANLLAVPVIITDIIIRPALQWDFQMPAPTGLSRAAIIGAYVIPVVLGFSSFLACCWLIARGRCCERTRISRTNNALREDQHPRSQVDTEGHLQLVDVESASARQVDVTSS